MERNNKLPEKWYIRGCEELKEYLRTVDNNQYEFVGLDSEYSYYINNNGIWDYFIGIPNLVSRRKNRSVNNLWNSSKLHFFFPSLFF